MTTPPNLPPGHVHVWQFPLQVAPPSLAAYALVLSPDERQRADRFARPELRRRFVVARATLRQLLAHYTQRPANDLHFSYGPAGKPELPATPWHFNVSHSDDLALIAIATGGPDAALGVDLEKIHPLDYDAVAKGILPDVDLLTLARALPSAKPDTFFRLWVRHEARVKALGAVIGSRADVPAYDLDLGPDYRAALATAIRNARISLFPP